MFGDVTCLCLMARSPWAQQIIVVDLGVVHVEKCSGGSREAHDERFARRRDATTAVSLGTINANTSRPTAVTTHPTVKQLSLMSAFSSTTVGGACRVLHD